MLSDSLSDGLSNCLSDGLHDNSSDDVLPPITPVISVLSVPSVASIPSIPSVTQITPVDSFTPLTHTPLTHGWNWRSHSLSSSNTRPALTSAQERSPLGRIYHSYRDSPVCRSPFTSLSSLSSLSPSLSLSENHKIHFMSPWSQRNSDFIASLHLNPRVSSTMPLNNPVSPRVHERWSMRMGHISLPSSTSLSPSLSPSPSPYATSSHSSPKMLYVHPSDASISPWVSRLQVNSAWLDQWSYQLTRPFERFFADVYMTDEMKAREEFEKTYAATEMNWTRF